MTSDSTQELENLLRQALQDLEFRDIRYGSMTSNAYRELLILGRQEHDTRVKRAIAFGRPVISGNQAGERVQRLVERELSQYLKEGKIQSATVRVFGGQADGNPTQEIAANLLSRALVDDARRAAQAFADCLNNTSCNFYRFIMISGIKIDAPFSVCDGVKLLPLPEVGSRLPPFLPMVDDVPSQDRFPTRRDFYSATLVQIEYEASPIFRMPDASVELNGPPDEHFSLKIASEEAADFDIHVLCQALAIAGRCNVQPRVSWFAILDYEIYDLKPYWGIGSNGHMVFPPEAVDSLAVDLTVGQLDAAKALYERLTGPITEILEQLRVPIDRLMKSMSQVDPVDQMIDVGIALECLYLQAATQELRYRFALHGAWHQGTTKLERLSLFDEFRTIYDARSAVVHEAQFRGSLARDTIEQRKFVERAQELCWNGIISVLDDGKMPSWADLVMGS